MFQEQKGKAVTVVRKPNWKRYWISWKALKATLQRRLALRLPYLRPLSAPRAASISSSVYTSCLSRYPPSPGPSQPCCGCVWSLPVVLQLLHIYTQSTNRSTRGGFHNGMSRGVVNLTTKYYFLCVSTPSPTVRVYGNRRVNKHTCKRAQWE